MDGQLRGRPPLFAVAVLLWGSTAAIAMAQASGQNPAAPSSAAEAVAGVPLGGVVYVTDASGSTTKGTVSVVKAGMLELLVRGNVRRISADDIRRLEWEKRDSAVNGVLIGAGVGAIPGIYWLIADPNECTGMCPEDYVSIAAGAIIGGLIDRAIKKRVTLYPTGVPGSRAKSVTRGGIPGSARYGLQIVVLF
jgi:hypothetical protein